MLSNNGIVQVCHLNCFEADLGNDFWGGLEAVNSHNTPLPPTGIYAMVNHGVSSTQTWTISFQKIFLRR
ncbi:MAG: hypothetical protein KAS32_16955 [Candidatus Peribacteraceae bacterium]|nr:hypothetical protein [Candidatus Peribacteraceae bacterium]